MIEEKSPRRDTFLTFDAAYLQRLKDRTPATQAHFASYFAPRLQMKLRHRGFDSHTVEDISQETFYRVLTAVEGETVLFPERFGAYVYTVCDKVILEKYREFARNQIQDLDAKHIPDVETDWEAVSRNEMKILEATLVDGKAISSMEEVKIVEAFLAELPGKKRDILRAVIFERLNHAAVCARFDVTDDYLQLLLFRAKTYFAALWKAKGRS